MREKNAGYTILEHFPTGEQGFAIGESHTAPAPYVTWQYRVADQNNLFWGHYFTSREDAYADYRMRIEKEVRDITERTHQPPRLPQLCLSIHPSTGDLINIRRGERGFYASDWNIPGNRERNERTAELMNAKWGVTKAQAKAMEAGSAFGWDCPAADPRRYDEQGNPQKQEQAPKRQRNKEHPERER